MLSQMITAHKLEELFIDGESVRHFDYIIMEVPKDYDRHMMIYHIEYYKDSEVQQIMVKFFDIVKLIKVKEEGIYGVIAKVGQKEISFIQLDPLKIRENFDDCGIFSYIAPDYDSMRSSMTKEPSKKLGQLDDPVFVANMETLFFTKMYIFLLSNYMKKASDKEWNNFLLKKQNAMRKLLLEVAEQEVGYVFHMKLMSKVLQSRACLVCGKEGHKKCTNCYSRGYCSKECQVKDWPCHKEECKKFENDRSYLQHVHRNSPIRVEAYFTELYKKPVIDYTRIKKSVLHGLVEYYVREISDPNFVRDNLDLLEEVNSLLAS